MNRRGHLSHKVPNVKLRPAPPPGATRSRGKAADRDGSPFRSMMDEEILRQAMEGEEDEDVSSAALRKTDRPWKNVTITLTGVDNKTSLAALAKELGANVESALTVHVTHVIAVGFGSPKYLYAVQHRLPVMQPSWIEDSHERWIAGEELDLEEDVVAHRLLPFAGLTIAISGIEPLERRKQIVQAINNNGGEYRKDLDRSCSHLVSAKATSDSKSSEKVKWAVKELKDREMDRRRGKKTEGEDMRIVYEEWIWDCVGYGGRWKEEGYDARKPRNKGKIRAEDVINGTVAFEDKKEEVPKTEAEAENEPAVVRKRKREGMESLVGEIISTTAVKVEPDEGLPQQVDIKPGDDTDLNDDGGIGSAIKSGEMAAPEIPTRSSGSSRKPSLLHASRTTSFSAGPSKLSMVTPEPDPSMPATAPVRPTGDQLARHNDTPQIFAGLRISHLIEESYEGLQRALVAHGAELVSEEDRVEGQEVDYVIVRLSSSARPSPVEHVKRPAVVTECWIEACCFEQSLLPLDRHLVFQPLPATMPVSGTSSFLIHLSGFPADQNTYLRRLIRVLGATNVTSMNRQTTHLVTDRTDGQKVEKAREWGLEIISQEWLLDMGRTGMLQLPNAYRLKLSQAVSNPPSQARMLKLTPTHIDPSGTSLSRFASHTSSTSLPQLNDSSHPLSPPKAETARRLNHAQTENGLPTSADDPSSSKMSGRKNGLGHTKAASAPDRESMDKEMEAKKLASGVGKAATTEGISLGNANASESLKGKGMTEVLRRLAEKGDSGTGRTTKVPRRTRPSGRFKSVTHSPATTSASPERPFNGYLRDTNPSRSPSESGRDPTDMLGDEHDNPAVEESMRVQIIDPKAEREKKRILDALHRRSKAILDEAGEEARLGVGGDGRSPAKRARR